MFSIPVTIWLVLTLVLAIVCVLAVWSRRNSWARSLSMAAFLLAVPVSGACLFLSLGWPVKLINDATVKSGDTIVLGFKMIIDDGIYLLVDRGEAAPRYVWLPWDPDVARQLQNAAEEAGPEGTVRMKTKPFEWSWDQSGPQFWADPQEKLMPDKPEPLPEPPMLGDPA